MLARPSICPRCHQRIHEVRAGVRMTPLKTHIYDTIKRAGAGGILLDDVNAIAFDGQSTRENVRVHINQINDILVATDLVIRGNGPLHGYYRLERRR
jgi:hypothetical protein